MKKTICLTLTFFLFLMCLGSVFSACAEDEQDEMAAAFSGNARLQLVPFIPDSLAPLVPEDQREEVLKSGVGSLLDISPDGKTFLLAGEVPDQDGFVYQIFMVRDGNMIQVQPNPAGGNGDPYDGLEQTVSRYARNLGGLEGCSWSDDGRYVTFSDLQRIFSTGNRFSDVPVIDTDGGKVWLADSYKSGPVLTEEGSGIVYLSRMSRNGDYVYYYMAKRNENGEPCRYFCRCAPEGGQPEMLVETVYSQYRTFDILSTSNLFEMADGSWLMVGVAGMGRSWSDSIALVRFSPSGERWTADVSYPFIPQILSPMRIDYSAASGTGLMAVVNQNANQIKQLNGTETQQLNNNVYICKCVNLVRLSSDGMACDVWYMRRFGENPADVEMVSGAEFLQYMQAMALGFSPEVPAGFSAVELAQRPNPTIYNCCLSPDGRYALLFAAFNDWERAYRLYLLNVETMEIRLVETPEGVGSKSLIAGSAFSKRKAGMNWKKDGTIVIMTEQGSEAFFKLQVH